MTRHVIYAVLDLARSRVVPPPRISAGLQKVIYANVVTYGESSLRAQRSTQGRAPAGVSILSPSWITSSASLLAMTRLDLSSMEKRSSMAKPSSMEGG
jgi:hypothetical protein